MLKVNLKVIGGGKHEGQVVPLTSSRFLIGRETDCHLRPNSEMVSRHHCAISVDDYAVRLRDLGSTNGTLVNGERIRGVVQLKAGDRVTVGKLDFEVQIGDDVSKSPLSTDTSALQGETAELSGDETHYEMPTFRFEPEPETESEPAANQTMKISAAELESLEPAMVPADAALDGPAATHPSGVAAPQQPPVAAPQQPPSPPQQQPMPGYQYPGQYPPPPGYPYGMGFPGPMPGYYPQYPQYPQYPYPQPVVMGQPYPPAYPQQQQLAPEPPPASADDSDAPDVRLPDPRTTGVKAALDPVPTADGAAPPPPPSSKNPSEHAADIIRQHLHRRPGIEDKK